MFKIPHKTIKQLDKFKINERNLHKRVDLPVIKCYTIIIVKVNRLVEKVKELRVIHIDICRINRVKIISA
jgi:hypothetical protein